MSDEAWALTVDRFLSQAKDMERLTKARQLADGVSSLEQVALSDALRTVIGMKRAFWRVQDSVTPQHAAAAK